MIDYTGIKCPVCGKPFTEHDDIVVCPECGAPYHRDCYEKTGTCIFVEHLHHAGKFWAPPQPEQSQQSDTQSHTRTKKCQRCGKINMENALFCDRCGQPLTGCPQKDFNHQQDNPANGEFPPFGNFPMGNNPNQPNNPIPFILDPMGGVNPAELIDDIPAGDVAKLVQNSTPYYMPTFLNLKRFGKNRFNFCAFLFSGGWLLYRKQYKIGAIITSIMAALNIASIYVTMYFSSDIISGMLQRIGVNADNYTLTYAQGEQLIALLYKLPPLKLFLLILPQLIFIIQLIIMIVTGFHGNKLYCQHCIDSIHKIASDNPSQADYTAQLQNHGGVNTSLAVCLVICHIIIVYLPRLL